MILKQCAKFQSNVLMDFETSMELKETLTVDIYVVKIFGAHNKRLIINLKLL